DEAVGGSTQQHAGVLGRQQPPSSFLLAPAPRQRRQRSLPARRITACAIPHRPEPVPALITSRHIRQPPNLLAAVHRSVVPAVVAGELHQLQPPPRQWPREAAHQRTASQTNRLPQSWHRLPSSSDRGYSEVLSANSREQHV